MLSRHPRFQPSAFTVIELMIVVAIIGVLLGITVPVLSRARRMTWATQSKANLRQLGVLTDLYKNDHKSLFPRPAETYPRGSGSLPDDRRIALLWYNAIDDYAGLKGPATVADKDKRNNVAWKQSPAWGSLSGNDQVTNHSFKMNDDFYNDDTGRYQTSEGMIRKPNFTVLYGDGRAMDLDGAQIKESAQFSLTTGIVGPRNLGNTVNIVFVDGHVSAESQPLNDKPCPGWYPETDKKGGKDRTLIWDFMKR